MSARRKEVELGNARGKRLVLDLCRDLDEAVQSAGLSYAAIGRAVGMSGDHVARICHGEHRHASLVQLATLFATVGLELAARAYPGGDAIRDSAHVGLIQRFRRSVGTAMPVRFEVPIVDADLARVRSGYADRRAWDAVVSLGGGRLAVEAETRVRDVQALLRKLELKRRDGNVERLVLLLNDTAHNRRVAGNSASLLQAAFPGSVRATLRAIRAGQLPAQDAVILL